MKNKFVEPDYLVDLVQALNRLPGIGLKSARRMVYHLLQYDIEGLEILSKALINANKNLIRCIKCNSFSCQQICQICSNPDRDNTILCIVETPSDMNVLESSKIFNGLYYVLMGKLSPLDGIGPKELNFEHLIERANTDKNILEVIIATNFTAEGETTAHYLSDILSINKNIQISRLSRGIPSGSEIEYIDSNSLAWAFIERKKTKISK
ncbi:Recombination protein RecR [Candidatus Kinetoplastibacterium sorsogonicusi]|uniref:Recombination protein RecR n=1 Tax=Candidatus Kinetoplastidibacterium kentomonadis TaxID=1576550 RepID=A0A3S7J9D2_9PROT|nr:recombination mediator RecR [Candidatus Kinetoplastibacterium sorsogonicusi]AWD32276.1 Recombination protein RecR [Candidatus Kinetoplastibacterium sorsogonicusi]